MTTTLNEIQKHDPCKNGWKRLLRSFGKREADDEPLSLIHILESNGIKDAIWCLRCVEGEDKRIRLFAVACVREVQHLMIDKKSLQVLDIAERFANGHATEEELLESLCVSLTMVDKDTISTADCSACDTTVCAAASDMYSNASIGVSVLSVSSDAVNAAVESTIDNNYIRNQVRNKALERQKELFIQFFGEETNDN